VRGGRPWSWITGRPRLVDAVVVMVTFLPALAGPTSVLRHGRDLWVIALSFVQVPAVSLPLWWRRQLPLAAAAVVMAGVLAGLAAGINLNLSAASFAFAFYAVSVYGSDRERPLAAAASTGLTVLGLLLRWGDLTGVGVVALMAWVVGDYFHGRRRHLAELLRDSRREAAEEERLRIARELHDVITHNLSSMAIHAGAARIGGAPGGDAHALQVIESTARETLAELNRLLGVLRKGSGRAELRPQPGLGELDTSSTRRARRAWTPTSWWPGSAGGCPRPSISPHTGSCRRPSPTLCVMLTPIESTSVSSTGRIRWSSRSPTTAWERPRRPSRSPPATAWSACGRGWRSSVAN
jgi:hypothetical protein